MVQTTGDFVGLQSLQIETHGLDTMGLAGSDVLLLAAAGDVDFGATQGLDVAYDGADPTVEQAIREVLVAEQPALFPASAVTRRMRARRRPSTPWAKRT